MKQRLAEQLQLTAFSTLGAALAALMVGSWHHYYNQNWQSGVNVLAQAKAFMDVPPRRGTDEFGNLQLPLLNRTRTPRPMVIIAITVSGGYGIVPEPAYVEQTYIQLLEQRYLPR